MKSFDGEGMGMRRNFDHTYETCVHSLKRKNAPWRVTDGCNERLYLFTGRHYELPNKSVCHTCPVYRSEVT